MAKRNKHKAISMVVMALLTTVSSLAYEGDSLLVPSGDLEELKSAGDAAYYAGNYVQALACYKDVLEYYQNENESKKVSKTLIFMAEIHRGARSFDLGLRKLDEVQLRLKGKQGSELHVYLYNRRAAILFELKEKEKAIKQARKSLFIEKNFLKKRSRAGNNLNIIGAAHRDLGNLDSAKFYLRKSLSIGKNSTNIDERIINIYNGGLFYYHTSNYDSSLFYLNKAKNLCLKNKRRSHLYHIYTQLSHVHEDLGDYKTALQYCRMQVRGHDSILNDNSKANFDRISEASEKIYSLKEKQLAQSKKETHRTIIVATSLVLLLAIVLALIAYYSKTKVKRLNNALLDKTEVLDNKNTELHELNEIKIKLFSLLAHDLRNPVASLSGLLGLLESDDLDDETKKEILKKLRIQFNNTEQLLGSIVTWSKSQIESKKVKPVRTNIKSIMESELSLQTQNATNKEIKIKMESDCSSDVKTDPDIVSLIIRNLLSNAIKFTPKGGEIHLGCKSDVRGGFSILIKDTGVGMSKEKVEQLFTAGNKTTSGTNKEKGFGLGLMLCYDFAKMLNAKISVESQLGSGSAFTVVFPAL